MKNIIKAGFILLAAIFVGCQSTSNLTNINEAIGKDWKLVEVRVNNRNTDFNRATINRDNFGEIFIIRIDRESISGVGAPNRYSAPYTASEDDSTAVTIGLVRSTLMMSIFEPEKLREHDFFIYIQNTYKWGISNERLELHSKNNDGASVVMIFSL